MILCVEADNHNTDILNIQGWTVLIFNCCKRKLNCKADWFLSVLYSVRRQTDKCEQPKRKSSQIININNLWVTDDHSVSDLDRMNSKLYLSHPGAHSQPLPLILIQWVYFPKDGSEYVRGEKKTILLHKLF